MIVNRDTHLSMLTYMRPAGSNAEKAFINRFIKPFDPEQDGYGNLFIVVGENPNVMFTSHTDTVHRKSGAQKIEVADDWVYAADSDCLGADCTTGVYIMLRMIQAEVPGLYAFFREEECGGSGSIYAAKHSTRFQDIDACISFDRKGFTSIITHQFIDRCCSERFAESLGAILPGEWISDPGGTFTDSANFVDIIGECTNLSVGYLKQHTKDESVHLGFVEALVDSLIAADWDKLEYERNPGDSEYGDNYRSYFYPKGVPATRNKYGYEDLVQAIIDYPEVAARLLQERGYSSYDIINEGFKGDHSDRPLGVEDLFPSLTELVDGSEPLMEAERITG